MSGDRTFDFFALDQRLLRLESPRFREALLEVRGLEDAGAAWDRLLGRGLLPASWTEPGRRVFRVPSRTRWFNVADVRAQPHPGSPRAVAWVAATAEVMLAVEALAWEVAEALVPWGQPRPRRLVWNVLPHWRLKQSELRSQYKVCHAMFMMDVHTGNAVDWRLGSSDNVAARLSSQRGRSSAQYLFVHDVSAHEKWRRAVAFGASVPRGPFYRRYQYVGPEYVPVPFFVPEDLVGRPYAELPDPCSPLLAIWDAGCALGSMSDDTLVVHLPPPPLDDSSAREAMVARIPVYRVGTTRAVPRASVLEFFRPFLAGPVDPGAPVLHCDDGSVLCFHASGREGLVFVELQCQFLARDGGVSTGHVMDFARFCEQQESQVKLLRNGHIVPPSEGTLFSDFKHSPGFRAAMHLAQHPRDVRIPE